MSTSDELRRMLDERGVEWRKPSPEYWVLLGMPEGDSSTIVGELNIEEAIDGTLVIWNATPAQAIAATLGTGTCEMEYVNDWMGWHCKSCDNLRMGLPDQKPKFCPNCGRRVMEVSS